MKTVVDANAVLALATAPRRPRLKGQLGAPPLLWPEVRSVVHVARWRGLVGDDVVDRVMQYLESGSVAEWNPEGLGREALRMSDELGWAKTYDAEYLALAALVGAELATFDRRLTRAAEQMDVTITPLVPR